MKSYSSRDVLKVLKADGWYEVACDGDHHQFKHPTKSGKVTLTLPKKYIPIGTLKSIERQAGVKFNYPPHPLQIINWRSYIMKDKYVFPAILYYAEDGISIEFPDLPGCYPCADTTEEATKNAKEALGLHLFGMERDNEEIPEPSDIRNISVEDGGILMLVEVFMPIVRERINNRYIKKTLTIPYWLNAEAESHGVNFSGTLQEALMQKLNISH